MVFEGTLRDGTEQLGCSGVGWGTSLVTLGVFEGWDKVSGGMVMSEGIGAGEARSDVCS